jgi:hypothetical protein
MRRATTIPPEDMSCSNKRVAYKSMADYERIGKPGLKENIDRIAGFTGAQIDSLKSSQDPIKTSTYYNALASLQVLEADLNNYISCINKDIIQRNDYSSQIYTLQQEVEQTRKEVSEKKQIASDAQERATQLENPYNKTTWWESWFPLGRPIRKENVPVLISISILMLVFSLGIFLRFAGKELRFESVGNSANSFLKNINSRKYQG